MAEKLPGGHETILLVDDQETVWDFLIEALQNLGYSVILAENGLDAVEICRENPGQIDLVLLDMIMPKMGGHSTFYRIRELDPNIKVLLSSGYVAPDAVNDLLANGAAVFFRNRTGSKHSPMNCAAFWTRRLRKKHPLRFEKLPFPGSYHTAVSCFIIKNS